MSEHFPRPAPESDSPPATPETTVSPEIAAALQKIQEFLRTEAPVLAQLFGVPHLSIEIGDRWATDLESGRVTVDLRFWLEQGYTVEMTEYALCHEVAAHLREVLTDPQLTHEVKKFLRPSIEQMTAHPGLAKARDIFHNIFSDVAGNNATHQLLPAMRYVAHDLYRTKLFAADDYQDEPRHLQFLYKFIREEMIDDSETHVAPEVDEMLAEFRDFRGHGDLLKYSTTTSISDREAMTPRERFELWTDVIYPRWLELFFADEADERFQQKPASTSGEPARDGTGSAPREGTPHSPTPNTPDFRTQYDNYYREHHPEPLSDEAHAQIERDVQSQRHRRRRKDEESRRKSSASYQRDAQLRRETGHGLAQLQRYNQEIDQYREPINRLRTLLRSILNEHVGTHKRLRGGYTEGATLDPDRIAQTYIDLESHVLEPPAFVDYQSRVSERELTGKTDYHVVFDRSGSMKGARARAAASTGVITMEALAGMQRDIETMQAELDIDINVDIRTAMYTFNTTISNPKPLSHGLTLKERLDTYTEIQSVGGGNADSHVLSMIDRLPIEHDRRQVLIFVCDGQADNKSLARQHIEHLRAQDWLVYGISIESEDAVELFAPHSRRIDDPALLPEIMEQLIGETL